MASMWDRVAYVARYGHLPLSEILQLTRDDMSDLQSAISRIVGRENENK